MRRLHEWALNRFVRTRFRWLRLLLLRCFPSLNGDEADVALRELLRHCEAEEQWDNVRLVEQTRAVLARSRVIGASMAIAEAKLVDERVPDLLGTAEELLSEIEGDKAEDLVHQAMPLLEEAERIAVAPHPYRPLVLATLGHALWQLHELRGDDKHLTASAVVLEEAYDLMGVHPVVRFPVLMNYATTLLAASAVGDGAELDRAAGLLAEALPLASGPELAKVWSGLGQVALERCFRATELDGTRREHADNAVSAFEQALAHSEDDQDLRVQQLNNLSVALTERFVVDRGSVEDLDRAETALREAIACGRPDSAQTFTARATLASTLIERHEVTGRKKDFDEADVVMAELLEQVDPAYDQYPDWQANAALLRQIAFERVGELDLLNEAIVLMESATSRAATPVVKASRCEQLATMLRERAVRRRDEAELYRAAALHQEAADTPGLSAGRLVSVLGNLGGTMRALAALTGMDRHRAAAVRAYQAALAAAPEQGAVRAALLGNLALGLQDQYDHEPDERLLEEVLALHRAAVGLTSVSSPFGALRLHHLAGAMRRAWAIGGASVDDTVEAHRDACRHGRESAPEIELRAGVAWMRWAEDRLAWQEISEADQHVLASSEVLLRRQASREDRAVWLVLETEAGALAARSLVERGDAIGAVERLERARGRLLTTELAAADRALAAADARVPHLADRYRKAAERLRELEIVARSFPLNRTSFEPEGSP
ncbi:hypothetical protein SAMN04488564_11712 [Lentzea waywayandensis]|uniref:Tetratricopeptide repeat-containing protein n=1 Tax=Lentzea waywayandensis TaxID=84724 RepID=A0A1I6FGP5_9PSEU|nr:hypothetical protein [Lentzea waywayandensis]SFR29088.1 hypothetical protein SAMN04488564_11712 [Lentzea waywayandensis]